MSERGNFVCESCYSCHNIGTTNLIQATELINPHAFLSRYINERLLFNHKSTVKLFVISGKQDRHRQFKKWKCPTNKIHFIDDWAILVTSPKDQHHKKYGFFSQVFWKSKLKKLNDSATHNSLHLILLLLSYVVSF